MHINAYVHISIHICVHIFSTEKLRKYANIGMVGQDSTGHAYLTSGNNRETGHVYPSVSKTLLKTKIIASLVSSFKHAHDGSDEFFVTTQRRKA